MLYMLATIEVAPGKMDEFLKVLGRFVPLVEKHGQKLLGSWRSVAGVADELTDLWCFESLSQFEKVGREMFSDPEVVALYKEARSLTVRETLKLLSPVRLSPMR